MPITKSAQKELRSSKRKRGFNNRRKVAMRGVIKDINKLLIDKKLTEAEKLITSAYKAIDKAAKRGVIKKNTAARKKSRLVAAIKKAK